MTHMPGKQISQQVLKDDAEADLSDCNYFEKIRYPFLIFYKKDLETIDYLEAVIPFTCRFVTLRIMADKNS